MNVELQRQHAKHLERTARIQRVSANRLLPCRSDVAPPTPCSAEVPVLGSTFKEAADEARLEGCRRYSDAGPTVRAAVSIVAAHYGIPPWRVLAPLADVFRLRGVAAAVLRRSGNPMSVSEIGRRLGGYDHSSILHAIKRADQDVIAELARAFAGAERQTCGDGLPASG